ncbi:13957_t:CDS:1, partial [Gigaspora rosea]
IEYKNSSIFVSELIRICNNSIESSETELKLVKELLEHANISEYKIMYPTEESDKLEMNEELKFILRAIED